MGIVKAILLLFRQARALVGYSGATTVTVSSPFPNPKLLPVNFTLFFTSFLS